MEFFDKKDNDREFSREFNYKYKKSDGFKDVNDYGEVCSQEYDVVNGTHEVCGKGIIGTHQEETFKWVELERSEKLPTGEITIGIFTDVLPDEQVEWIPTLFSVRINQWSTWTESLNVDLNAYYYMDEGSGTSAEDVLENTRGGLDLTVDSGAWDTGRIGSSNLIDGDANRQRIINVGGNTSFTANIWVKGTAHANQQFFISSIDPVLATCDDAGWDDSPFGMTVMPGGEGRLYFCDGTTRTQSIDHAGVGDNNWHMLTITLNSTNAYYYDDGVSYDNDDYAAPPLFPDKWVNVSGMSTVSYKNKNFFLDEISFHTRDLSPTEVLQLYNSGSGIQYFLPDTSPPSVIPLSPDNRSYNTAINFTVNSTDKVSMENGECWVSIDGGTTNISMLNASTHTDIYNYTAPTIYSEGGYLAEFSCNDTEGNLNNTESVSFNVDLTNPNINITFPINNSMFTINTINVNYTVSDNSVLGSCWYSNDTYLKNTTLATCGTNITTIIWSEGQHNVTIWVNDSAGNENSTGVSFSIDAIVPNINITSPQNNSNHTDRNLDVNFTASDILGLFNCWYSNDTYVVNISLATCGTNITDVIWSKGNHNVTVWANDTAGNQNSSSVSFTIFNIVENSQSFSATALEQSSQTFSINITYDSTTFSNIQAIFHYNNSANAGARVFGTGDQAVFNRTITTPSVDTKTNFTFYWAFTLTSTVDEKVNSTFKNQTISSMVVGDCNSESIGLYNFTIVDENTLVKLSNPTWNTSAKVHIELFTLDRATIIANFSQNFTKINPFTICLNNSLSGGETYTLNAQIQYGATNYTTEFYHIQFAIINSTTLAQNITLYDLDASTSTSFKIIYKDANFLPLANALIQIQRKYISRGIFRTVEIPKTDSNGQTIANLEEKNAIYTFIII